MSNILNAISNVVLHQHFQIGSFYRGRNRANSMGDALENYIKDAFAGTFEVSNESERISTFQRKFSWLGSQNNPPDIIIRGGDAIEVKKTQSSNSSLALNSSYPKAELRSSSPMITSDCRECEDWTVKDLIYCVGHTTDTRLKSLWMVYGNIFAAKHDTYERIKSTISSGIKEIPDVVFSETKELGRVNQVDPLGITNLRIRGMWQIENPRRVFNYLHESTGSDFELICIIPASKYNSFPEEDKTKLEQLSTQGVIIQDKKVKNPNNPATLVDCKFIKYSINT